MLREALEKLRQKRADKEARLAENALSFPELRDKLLARVKSVKGGLTRPNRGFGARAKRKPARRGQPASSGGEAARPAGREELADGRAEAEGGLTSTRFSTPRSAKWKSFSRATPGRARS